MLNIKVQRLKCYRNKKIKTEKLRNTNMLDKCRNITLTENRWQTKYFVSNTCFTRVLPVLFLFTVFNCLKNLFVF